jgi:hypothetical protein
MGEGEKGNHQDAGMQAKTPFEAFVAGYVQRFHHSVILDLLTKRRRYLR